MVGREEVAAACDEWARVAERREWRRFPDLLTEDATVMNTALDEPIVGRAAIRDWVEAWADDPIETDIEWLAIDGDRVAVGWRQRFVDDRPPDQQPSTRGIQTMVYGGNGLFRSFENFFDMKRLEALMAAGS